MINTIYLLILFIPLVYFNVGNGLEVFIDGSCFKDAVCSIIKDIRKNETAPQEVLMASNYINSINSVFGDMTKCIGNEIPVVIAKLDDPIGKQDSRKASIMVIAFESIDEKTLHRVINMQLKSYIWNHMAKTFIIIRNIITKTQSIKLQNFLFVSGFYNVVIVHRVNGTIFVDYSKTIRNDFYSTNVIENGHRLFPDKLKNLQSYAFRIPVIDEIGRVRISQNNVTSPMLYFLNILSDKLNVSIRFYRIDNVRQVSTFWMNKRMDLILNTVVTFDTSKIRAPKLMTYEQNGYCALVPLPQNTAIFDVIFLKPFDSVIWICLGVTILACLMVWWLFYERGTQDSHLLLMFAIFAMFVGQGVDIRQTRRYVLLILLQMIVAMIFVLSNGYQGVITSFMIQPLHENRLENVEDLLKSSYRIITSETFVNNIKDSEEFQAIKSRIEVTELPITTEIVDDSSKKGLVMIMKCNIAETIKLKYKHDYYILPQHVLAYYEHLEASFYNPLIEKMQYYMDLSFQAGLQQAWGLFAWNNQKIAAVEDHNAEYLELKDLVQVFYILFIGNVLGALVFLVEIFFRDFINNFSLRYETSKIRKFINQIGTAGQMNPKIVVRGNHVSRRQRKQRPKVRIINVKPVNLEA